MKAFARGLGVAAVVTIVIGGCRGTSSGIKSEQSPDVQAVAPKEVWQPGPEANENARIALARKHAKLKQKSPARFDQPQEAQEFFIRQRLPLGKTELPLEHLQAELERLKLREAALVAKRGTRSQPGGIVGWNEIGPGNIGGRTRTIVINPIDPNTMYAAGVTGGIWKSTDAGANWQPTDDFLPNLAVSTIVMDPTDPNTLYAGTGEGFFGSWTKHRGLGIFKSIDAGTTWDLLSGTVTGVPEGSFYYVNKLAISPNDHNRIYAATMFGVWRSLDAGLTWDVVLRNPWALADPPSVQATNGCSVGCTDIVIRPDQNPDIVWAAFGSSSKDGLYRSNDGGDTWVEYQTGTEQGRMTLAIAPSNNDRMYILMAQNSSGSYGKLYSVFRSDDGGNAWYSSLDFGHPFSEWLLSYVAIATGCYDHPVIYSQGWYDNIIAVDPLDPDIVWVGGIDLYRSDNGGVTFGLAEYWFYYLEDPPPPTLMHPDQHAITFHPDYNGTTNQIMFVGNDGGLEYTTNARAATTQEECPMGEDPGPPPEIIWSKANNGYGVTQYYHGDSAKEIDMFVGGTQDNGTSRALAIDMPNDWRMIYGGDGGYVAIDPTNSQTLFIEIQGFPTIKKSTDGGENFEEAIDGITDTDGLFISPYAMDQNDPNILWTGGTRPWRTTNSAELWELAGSDLAGPDQISAIAIAPSDSNIVYLAFTNGYVVRSTDALAPSPTWTIFTNGLYGGWVSSLAVDPVDPNIAYLTYSNYGIPHVLRSTNGGNDWVSIDGSGETSLPDIPAHWIAVRPCDSQQLYVGTELGVFASDDSGASWNPVNIGLPHAMVETLDFKNNNRLVAFTHGRSAFTTPLEPCPCVVSLADLNCDGSVNSLDIDPFVLALTDRDSYLDEYADCCLDNADTNSDGSINSLDIDPFVGLLTGG